MTWFFANRLIVNGTDGAQVYYIDETAGPSASQTTSRLRLASARRTDAGVYGCLARNAAGQAAANVTLAVASQVPPFVSIQLG